MELTLVLAAFAILLSLNIKATVVIVHDELLERGQKAAQLATVWVFPLIGAILVFAINRQREAPSHKYRESQDAGDDFTASGRSVKSVTEAIDGD